MKGESEPGVGGERNDLGDQARERLDVIVAVMSGRMGVDEACARLGVGPARFYQLRDRALQGAAQALTPRPAGRPAKTIPEQERQRLALEARVRDLEEELQAALVRTEIALAMPNQLRGVVSKKNSKRRHRRRTSGGSAAHEAASRDPASCGGGKAPLALRPAASETPARGRTGGARVGGGVHAVAGAARSHAGGRRRAAGRLGPGPGGVDTAVADRTAHAAPARATLADVHAHGEACRARHVATLRAAGRA